MHIAFGEEQYYKPDDASRTYNYFNPIELSKLNIKLFNDNGKIYDSNRIDNYIILELIMLQDEAPDNLGFHPKQNNSIKDIKSKVDTLILNDSDVMISNKTNNDFLDIKEDLTINKKPKKDNLIDAKKDNLIDTNTESIVNNEQKNETNIIDLENTSLFVEPEGVSNISKILNSSSKIKDPYNESSNSDNESNSGNESNIHKVKNKHIKNDTRKIESNIQKELFKDRDKIKRLFEDYKLIILSIGLFILIVFIVKALSKNKISK